MNPQDFLQTAIKLSESMFEADMRSSISRAYYAALHTSFFALPDDRKPNLKAHDESTHSKVIGAYDGWYRGPGDNRSDKRMIKEMLVSIKSQRKNADYSLEAVINSKDVSNTLELAKSIIRLALAL